jgi:DNA-binding XRE family transcriptional regulator
MRTTVPYPVRGGNYSSMHGGLHSFQGGGYAFDMSIGQKIRQRREELNIKPSALAKQVGLSRQAYNNLEKGRQNSTTKLHLICKILGLNPDWVESGKGPRLASGYISSQVGLSPTISFTDPVALVTSDQINEGAGMAGMAREVLEVALLLTSLPPNVRAHVFGMIRSMVQESARPEKDLPDKGGAPQTLHITK